MSGSIVATASSRRRRVVLLGALALVIVALAMAALSLGSTVLAPDRVVAVLVGAGNSGDEFVVGRLRLPRLILGLLVGACLGCAGALLQSLLRNPLASPDIIGISQGASVGAVTASLIWGATGLAIAGAALVGGLTAAAASVGLAWRERISGTRFVVVGIAIAFGAQAVINLVLTRADVRDAQSALVWLVGSVGNPSWPELAVLAATAALLIPIAIILTGRLRILALGDDLSTMLGLRVALARAVIIGVAVALASVAIAAAGPLAFVAFMAPVVARALDRSGGPAIVASTLLGAAIVVGADLVAQHGLPGGASVPAGIVTGLVGAPVVIAVIVRSARGRAAA